MKYLIKLDNIASLNWFMFVLISVAEMMTVCVQNTERAKEDIKLALGVLNQHLLTRTYLVGERISLADICVACNLLSLYQLASIIPLSLHSMLSCIVIGPVCGRPAACVCL